MDARGRGNWGCFLFPLFIKSVITVAFHSFVSEENQVSLKGNTLHVPAGIYISTLSFKFTWIPQVGSYP